MEGILIGGAIGAAIICAAIGGYFRGHADGHNDGLQARGDGRPTGYVTVVESQRGLYRGSLRNKPGGKAIFTSATGRLTREGVQKDVDDVNARRWVVVEEKTHA